jgi:beta-RFAP synthase
MDLDGSLGRKFGSIGLAISEPSIKAAARFSDGPEKISVAARRGADAETILKYARKFFGDERAKAAGANKNRPCEIEVENSAPSHKGFGSGTQIALCVVSSLMGLYGIPGGARVAAEISGRGLRSGIGIAAFDGGGFIIDGGAETNSGSPPLTLFRLNFPENWKIVLVIPPGGAGLSGEAERGAFAGVMPGAERSREICHIVLMKLLPSLLEKKLRSFGEAIERIQEINGDSFSPWQSGRFASPAAEDLFRVMRKSGATGLGQSSWGPAMYGFAEGSENAEAIARCAREAFAGVEGLQIQIVSARNTGAEMTIL